MCGKRYFMVRTACQCRFAIGLAMLAMTCSSQALHTNFLNDCSNTLAGAYTLLTNNPSPTRQEQRAARRISRALKEFRKPSASVAIDCRLFATATARLGELTLSPDFLPSLTNALVAFVGEAQAEIQLTAARITALNDFVRAKKLASTQLDQAQVALNSINPLADVRRGSRVGRRVFLRIMRANRFAEIAEMHPGFAPDSIIGMRVSYGVTRGPNGFYAFTNSTQYEQAEITSERSATTDEGTYAYTRTGLNTAYLVLNGTGITNTMKLAYRSRTNGAFKVRTGSGRKTQSGTFAVD